MPKCGRRMELPPFEGQVAGVMNSGFVNRNAPFGTQFTPTFRTKIVGGKQRYVKETQRSFKLPGDGLEQPVSQRTTHDDAVQTDFDQTESQKVAYDKQRSSQEWKNHSVLPPIAASTDGLPHQERTHWSSNPPPPDKHLKKPQSRVEHLQTVPKSKVSDPKMGAPEQPYENSKQPSNVNQSSTDTFYEPRTYDNHEVQRQHQWKPAAGYSYLPTQPINLSKDQEIFLLQKMSEDVAGCNLDQAKLVYQEMAANDKSLSGWGTYTDLGLALQKHGIYPNLNTLRLLASTCVSTVDIGYVDYEKMLSFLITAIKKSKEAPTEPPSFYSPRDDHADAFSPHLGHVGSEGKLLRMVQQQLLQSNAKLDIEQLRTAFSKADRSHRLTLSQNQVKEICHRMSVPIHDDVINEMLAHCQTHGDGQYLWTDFINILEKVQPHATGLFIPQSKRPLEYAKKYRQPNENWPHPDQSHVRLQPIDSKPLPSTKKTQHSVRDELIQQAAQQEVVDFPQARKLQHQHISAPAALNTSRSTIEGTHKQYEQVSPRGLGLYNAPKVQPWSKESDPWFDGFTKMAEALYRNDLNRRGSMKDEQCSWLISEYNEIYDLQLHPQDIAQCIHRNTTTSGTEIDGLLQHLLALHQS